MSTHARQKYLEGGILQADPMQLIRILYRAALESLGRARQAIMDGDIAERSLQITRVAEIVRELALAVDHDKGGEIAQNLVELYDYAGWLLQDSNFRNADAPLEEVQKLLSILLEGWEMCPGDAPALNTRTPHLPQSLDLTWDSTQG